ncbi:MAG: heavy-metal-associated domain-containing protein [Erysipelotrichaceae bacterium]
MQSYKIIIEDMKCKQCANKITEAFYSKDKNAALRINLASKEVLLDSDLSIEEICDTIDEAGYTFLSIEIC